MKWIMQEAPHHVGGAGEDTGEDSDHRFILNDRDIEKLKQAIDVNADHSNGSIIEMDEGASLLSLTPLINIAVAAVTPTSGA